MRYNHLVSISLGIPYLYFSKRAEGPLFNQRIFLLFIPLTLLYFVRYNEFVGSLPGLLFLLRCMCEKALLFAHKRAFSCF